MADSDIRICLNSGIESVNMADLAELDLLKGYFDDDNELFKEIFAAIRFVNNMLHKISLIAFLFTEICGRNAASQPLIPAACM